MKEVADVRGVQVSVGRQDMNDELWVKLAGEVNRLLALLQRSKRPQSTFDARLRSVGTRSAMSYERCGAPPIFALL